MIGSHEALVAVGTEEILFTRMCSIVTSQFVGSCEKLAAVDPIAGIWPLTCSEAKKESITGRQTGIKGLQIEDRFGEGVKGRDRGRGSHKEEEGRGSGVPFGSQSVGEKEKEKSAADGRVWHKFSVKTTQ